MNQKLVELENTSKTFVRETENIFSVFCSITIYKPGVYTVSKSCPWAAAGGHFQICPRCGRWTVCPHPPSSGAAGNSSWAVSLMRSSWRKCGVKLRTLVARQSCCCLGRWQRWEVRGGSHEASSSPLSQFQWLLYFFIFSPQSRGQNHHKDQNDTIKATLTKSRSSGGSTSSSINHKINIGKIKGYSGWIWSPPRSMNQACSFWQLYHLQTCTRINTLLLVTISIFAICARIWRWGEAVDLLIGFGFVWPAACLVRMLIPKKSVTCSNT